MTSFRYPTPEEVSALERAARRARAEEMARLAKAAVASVRRAAATLTRSLHTQSLKPRVGH